MKRFSALFLALLMSIVLVIGMTACAASTDSTLITNPTTNPTGSETTGSKKPTDGTREPHPSTAVSPDVQLLEQKSADLMKTVFAAARSEKPALPSKAASQAYNRFSAALLKESAGNDGNVMISPASVFLALAMTLNGADTETRDAILKTLVNQGITREEINQTSRDWMALLDKTGEKTTLKIANSIWFDQDFAPYIPFLQTNADYFGAGARKLNFRDPESVDVINSWVNEATRGTIEEIVQEIPEDAIMYLINAIYFKSDWKTPFDKADTRKRIFNSSAGQIETEFLNRIGTMNWFEINGTEGVALPYENEQFAYFALLPTGNQTPREWITKQDENVLFTELTDLMKSDSATSVALSMPKFESEYKDSIKNELSKLGMEIAFLPNRADFSLMNESRTKDLFIGDVIHKTFVRVDEKGTEAAAVTSVEMRTTGMPISEKELVFDKPFVYGIMDLDSGMPLFVGIMEKPEV